ncbi:MAG: 1-phosphofructokinase family hexose kinase [Chloroflexota bacterium]
MILCVSANAAIDKTVIISPFRLDQIHRPQSMLALAGGKGCNVARALKTLGENALVTGWVGGFAGQFIERELQNEAIETAFVHTDAESRTCLSILDPEAGTLTEIYERGEPVSSEKIDELIKRFGELIPGCSAVALSGSLPAGVPLDFYAQLITVAHTANVPVYLDTSGEALKRGLEAKPDVIKPNKREFTDFVGGSYFNRLEEYTAAAREVAARYETTVILSLGSDGALAVTGSQVVHARPPQVTITSAVGSGDSLLAGLIYASASSTDLAEHLRCGVAAGTANTLAFGAGLFTREDFERIYADVKVEF